MGLTLNVKGNVKIEQYIETQYVGTQYVGKQFNEKQFVESEIMDVLPPAHDYKKLYEWIQQQKQQGRDYLAQADYNRTKMCKELSAQIGWIIDPDTLGKKYKMAAKN